LKNTRDLVSSLFWMAFGVLFTIGGLRLGLVRMGIPGPGSMPFIVGLVLIGLSLIHLIQAVFPTSVLGEKIFAEWRTLKHFLLALVGLIAYGFFLKNLGFSLTTFLFLFFALRFIGREKWTTALIFSISTAVVSNTLFTALQVNLPKGILGF